MINDSVVELKRLLSSLDAETLKAFAATLDDPLRQSLVKALDAPIANHPLVVEFRTPADMILEAIRRGPPLTKWMLRGVIADAAFERYVMPRLLEAGWQNAMPDGNHSFDYRVSDQLEPVDKNNPQDLSKLVSIQVKLQRSQGGNPVETSARARTLLPNAFKVEVQRTRTGETDDEESINSAKSDDIQSSNAANGSVAKSNAPVIEDEVTSKKKATRPYRFGEFDILAVSLEPSTHDWSSFRYTLGRWLVPAKDGKSIATMQPVPKQADDCDWTDDLILAIEWLRSDRKKTIANGPPPKPPKPPRPTKSARVQRQKPKSATADLFGDL